VHERFYIRRRGRMTRAQARALDELYADRCVPPDGAPLDADALFGRRAPIAVEIGFGMGHALAGLAANHPDWNCLGIEVYRPGIGALLHQCQARGLDNVRILEGDARAAFRERLAPRSVHRIHVFFPDPWPKARHHKRRLIEPAFAALLASRLEIGGRLLLATDWADYAEGMLEVLDAEPGLRNLAPGGGYFPQPADRATTRFEQRGLRLGHAVFDLAYEAVPAPHRNSATTLSR
jgi:tRNA (guanine-N7-)-methyltransferase